MYCSTSCGMVPTSYSSIEILRLKIWPPTFSRITTYSYEFLIFAVNFFGSTISLNFHGIFTNISGRSSADLLPSIWTYSSPSKGLANGKNMEKPWQKGSYTPWSRSAIFQTDELISTLSLVSFLLHTSAGGHLNYCEPVRLPWNLTGGANMQCKDSRRIPR